jgi:hypothetical protein
MLVDCFYRVQIPTVTSDNIYRMVLYQYVETIKKPFHHQLSVLYPTVLVYRYRYGNTANMGMVGLNGLSLMQ